MLFFDVMQPGAQKAKLYFFVALLWALSGNRRETILTVLAAVAIGIVWKSGTLIGAALMAYVIWVLAAYRWGGSAGRLPVTLIFLMPVAVGILAPSETGAIADVMSFRLRSLWERLLIWEWAFGHYLETLDAMKLLFGSGWRASVETSTVRVFHHGMNTYREVGGAQSMHSSALTLLFDFGVAGLLALTGVLNYLMGRTYGDYLTTKRMRATLAFFIVVCAVTLNFYYDYILIYLAFVVSIILCQRRAVPEFGRPG